MPSEKPAQTRGRAHVRTDSSLLVRPDTPTPYESKPADTSSAGSNSNGHNTTGAAYSSSNKYFKSRRIKKGEIERPWLEHKDPREKWVWIVPLIGIVLGVAVSVLLIWNALRGLVRHKYCTVLDEDFSHWNPHVWTKEVQVDGFGNGQFEMTTDTEENVFIKNGVLNIKPTFQESNLLENDYVLDLRGKGCTGTSEWYQCVTATNTTNGTIINPVKSGRVNTKRGASIKYGRVEVTARLPVGDWLFPAIRLSPTHNVYGDFPRSGEVDAMVSRGNNFTYYEGGNNVMSSCLHFGPSKKLDGWWKNNVKAEARHSAYSDGFHTYGIEWSHNYIYTYIDTRLSQILFTHFDAPFWEYGRFPLADYNGTRIKNPWEHTNSYASPFDQDFYLQISLGVGSTNGWFDDGLAGKPWIDKSKTARRDFWLAMDQWFPTWKREGRFEIKRVRIWQQTGYNGCKA